MTKNNYVELSSGQINDVKDLVISEYNGKGFTLSQRIKIDDGGKRTNVFLKNAIHIDDLSGLYNLRDALNLAIHKIEKK